MPELPNFRKSIGVVRCHSARLGNARRKKRCVLGGCRLASHGQFNKGANTGAHKTNNDGKQSGDNYVYLMMGN